MAFCGKDLIPEKQIGRWPGFGLMKIKLPLVCVGLVKTSWATSVIPCRLKLSESPGGGAAKLPLMRKNVSALGVTLIRSLPVPTLRSNVSIPEYVIGGVLTPLVIRWSESGVRL